MLDKRTRRRRAEQYQDKIARLFPELVKYDENNSMIKSLSRTVTFQVTDNCNLACTYCYQTHKGKRVMSLETAKKFVDLLLSGDKGMKDYIDPSFSPAIIIDFIGGEPFLAIDLISEICDYFFHEAIRLHHPWAEHHMFSLCSNGVLYRDPRVQKFLQKHRSHLSLSITVDGNKELHDSCRVFPDGSPSYDFAVDAVNDWMSKGYYMGSKITIAPGNIQYVYSAIIHMIDLGYQDIHANCVYEKGWELEHANILYNQMKMISDYLLENHLIEEIYISLFVEDFFKPKPETDLNNWCFRAGTMISTFNGEIPIEQLAVGDKVYTSTGDLCKIERILSREAKDGFKIKALDIPLTYTTASHPYLCKKHNGHVYSQPFYIPVENIKAGDLIAYMDDNISIKWSIVEYVEKTEEDYEVFNLTVEDNHTFIANGAIVHNCGGTGLMLACDPDGYLYPCLRYMESSLGDRRAPLRIGHIDTGIGQTEETREIIHCLNCIDRRTESTDECFYCPIAGGCSWCSAYNYEVNGTPDSRVTYICDMHKARALANAYHWAKYYESIDSDTPVELWVPDQWALSIIPKEEWEMLKNMKNIVLKNPENKEMIKE